MNSLCFFILALDRRAQTATDLLMWIVHIANVDLLAIGEFAATSFINRSVVGHELGLVDSLGFTGASAEKRRHACAFLCITESMKMIRLD